MGKFNNRKSMFRESESGSVALIVGLALTSVVIGILAITVDLGKAQTGYTKTSDAADATAHSVAEFIQHYQMNYYTNSCNTTCDPNWQSITDTPTLDELNKYANTVFLQNLSNDQASATPLATNTVTISLGTDANGQIVVTVIGHAQVQNNFAQLLK